MSDSESDILRVRKGVSQRVKTALLLFAACLLLGLVFFLADSSQPFWLLLVEIAFTIVSFRVAEKIEGKWTRARVRRKYLKSGQILDKSAYAKVDKAYRRAEDLNVRIGGWGEFTGAHAASPWSHFYLGQALTEKKLFPEALKSMEKAHDLDGDDVEIRTGLAEALVGCRRYAEGISLLSKVREAAPRNQNASEILIAALILDNRLDEARQEARAFCLHGGRLDRRVRKLLSL